MRGKNVGLAPTLDTERMTTSRATINPARSASAAILELRRSRESIREQRWFLREFPDLVHTLPYLLPLYNQGLRR